MGGPDWEGVIINRNNDKPLHEGRGEGVWDRHAPLNHLRPAGWWGTGLRDPEGPILYTEFLTVQSKNQKNYKNRSRKIGTLIINEKQKCDIQFAPTRLNEFRIEIPRKFIDFLYNPWAQGPPRGNKNWKIEKINFQFKNKQKNENQNFKNSWHFRPKFLKNIIIFLGILNRSPGSLGPFEDPWGAQGAQK